MTTEQVEALLAHELAHIRRYDHMVNILQRLIEAFLFFHPAVWFDLAADPHRARTVLR